MPYRVELSRRAQRDLIAIFEFIHADESLAAAKWFNGLDDLIASLATFAHRGTVTEYDPTLRFLTYGRKPHIYLVLFRINESTNTVAVRHIRHGARKCPGRV